MNDNVILFPDLFADEEYEEMLIWECDCGSTTFHYHIAEGLECSLCGTFQEGEDDDIPSND